ncbi:MAG: hypothetical protein AB8G15_18825 [Saprospiraceae bacterium]
MKKSNLQAALVGFLLVASCCCYIFLNTVTVTPVSLDSNNTEYQEGEELKSSGDILMPDIELIKKVLSRSTALLPATS